jgi:hypothetical protein
MIGATSKQLGLLAEGFSTAQDALVPTVEG